MGEYWIREGKSGALLGVYGTKTKAMNAAGLSLLQHDEITISYKSKEAIADGL